MSKHLWLLPAAIRALSLSKSWTFGQTQRQSVVSLLSRLWEHLGEKCVGSVGAVCGAGPERLLVTLSELPWMLGAEDKGLGRKTFSWVYIWNSWAQGKGDRSCPQEWAGGDANRLLTNSTHLRETDSSELPEATGISTFTKGWILHSLHLPTSEHLPRPWNTFLDPYSFGSFHPQTLRALKPFTSDNRCPLLHACSPATG